MPIITKKPKTGEQRLVCDVCGKKIPADVETNSFGVQKIIPKKSKYLARFADGLRVRVAEQPLAEGCVGVAEVSPYVCSKKCEIACYLEPEKMLYHANEWSFRIVKVVNTTRIHQGKDGVWREIPHAN